MRILMAQLNPTLGDLAGNQEKILNTIERGREKGAELIVFPELALSGYPPRDLLLHDDFLEASEEAFEQIVKASKDLCLVVGLPRRNLGKGKPLFNSAAVIFDGQILGYHDKCLLPTYNVFDERRYFEPGKGVKLFEVNGKRVAVLICEDIWQHAGLERVNYSFDPVAQLAKRKPDLLLNLSASPYQFEKPDERLAVCSKAAKTLQCPVFVCCQVGGNDDLVFDGYSVCVDQKGALRQIGKGFEEDLIFTDLSASACHLPFIYDPLEDLFRALVLGVRDYFQKQGFRRALIGLSGGIDSSLVACIAKEALGAKNVLGVAMPSRYSSEGSLTDAEGLSKNLGIRAQTIPIETIFSAYLSELTPFFEGKAPDTTEENLQARIRGMILMALSNKHGHIVLSTGNKSEMGLGYCTLYGDMCGGLGVISDVLKTQVYALCRWINRSGEVIPWSVIEKPPSAELKPDQKDLDSLPDYGIVDRVLKGYVEDLLSPEEISKQEQIDKGLVDDLIHRLHCAEYKRRQAPPGIRVSKVAFSVGRRFPIVHKWR